MANGRGWVALRRGLTALAVFFAFAANSMAGTLAASTSADIISMQPLSQFADASRRMRTLRDGMLDQRAGAWSFPTSFLPFNLSPCQADGCAGNAATLEGTHGMASTATSRFQAPITWQSSFSVAGSRVWSKFIKFSRNGINVRLPLN